MKKSPKLSTVSLPASILFFLSVVLYYRASESSFSQVQRPPASVYNLSKPYGDLVEDSSPRRRRNRVKKGGRNPIQDPRLYKPLIGREGNVLPPGITLTHFTTYMKRQMQGEEDGSNGNMARRIAEACEQYQSVMSVPNYASYRKLYRHLLYESNNRLVYCPVWKAMSTSWDAYLLQMAQFDPSNEDTINKKHYEMEGYIKRAAQARFKLSSNNKRARNVIEDSSCSVMIVRHPFQRLVSAYRDKMIARNSTVKDYLYLRTVIKHRYRTNVSEVTSFPTFHEFVDFVLDEWSSSDPRPGTWHEWSRDWHPAYYICAPCHMNYTHILRYEHYKSDVKDFRQECHLEKITLEGTHHHQLGNTSSAQVEDELYGQLSYSQVVQLTQMYFIDLVMFGYNVSRYLQFARPD